MPSPLKRVTTLNNALQRVSGSSREFIRRHGDGVVTGFIP
jgi:hypothetical protein